jgi:mRNA-degrading endonuclease toxin of MazEF toxin-antitoxin module
MIRPGEIYMADFGPAGPPPVIVMSREELNRGRYALVVVCTSARFALRGISSSKTRVGWPRIICRPGRSRNCAIL